MAQNATNPGVEAGGSAPLTPVSERQRIDAQRHNIRMRYSKGEAGCYQQFAVNRCLEELQAQRREALADLRRQEIELNTTERRNKGAAQLQTVDQRALRTLDRLSRAPAEESSFKAGKSARVSPRASRAGKTASLEAGKPGLVATPSRSGGSVSKSKAKRVLSPQEAKARQIRYEARLREIERAKAAATRRAAERPPGVRGLPVPP